VYVGYDHGREPGDSLAPEKRHHDPAAGIDPIDPGTGVNHQPMAARGADRGPIALADLEKM